MLLIILIFVIGYFVYVESRLSVPHKTNFISKPFMSPTRFITITPVPEKLPIKKVLTNDYQVFQTFNNCGPASLSMALSYFNIHVSQKDLGDSLRPFQNPQGDNDDKSVTLDEMADEAKKYNLIPYHRPNGNAELVKLFITADTPVLVRTLLTPDDDIGHYRVIKGYDDSSHIFIQDDSMQGHNVAYSYEEFNRMWKFFNYEYLVLVPAEKEKIARHILGENVDIKTSWKLAAEFSEKQLAENPSDIFARFNRSVALYNIGDYNGSITEYERVEKQLPLRTLWYQIEPIEAYYEVGNYEKVFSLTDEIVNHGNRAFSEVYYLRAKIYSKQSRPDLAKEEFDTAVYYNHNFAGKSF